jgi:small GTP-binding protein
MDMKREFSIVVVGDSGVGKSALLSQYLYRSFDPNYMSTIGIDIGFATRRLEDNTIRFKIFDTGGQVRFRTITENYIRAKHDGTIIVFDITDEKSFMNVRDFIQRVKDLQPASNKNHPILLVGNKNDLSHIRCIPMPDAEELAKSFGCDYVESTAINYISSSRVFEHIIQQIIDKQREDCHDDSEQIIEASSEITSKPSTLNKFLKKMSCMC